MTGPDLDDPTARSLLRHVERVGYRVSVHYLDASLLGTVPACVELHAVDVRADPPQQHVAKAADDEPDAEYAAPVRPPPGGGGV